MGKEDNYDSVIGLAHAADMIRYIYDNEQVYASELRAVTKNYSTIVQIARALEGAGLLTIHVETSPRVTHTYRLTEKGKKVAEKLKEVEKIIRGV